MCSISLPDVFGILYKDDLCEYFMPHLINENKYDPIDPLLYAKMHKEIAIDNAALMMEIKLDRGHG